MQQSPHGNNHKSQDAPMFQKVTGGTTYQVHIHFNDTAKENLKDKILRMLESEVMNIA